MRKTPSVSKRFIAVATVAVALVLTLVARPAFADTGTVTQVEYNVGIHALGLELNHSAAIIYIAADKTTSPCSSQSVDEVKEILAIAQASYLSGRPVSIGYSTSCNGTPYITDIALQ